MYTRAQLHLTSDRQQVELGKQRFTPSAPVSQLPLPSYSSSSHAEHTSTYGQYIASASGSGASNMLNIGLVQGPLSTQPVGTLSIFNTKSQTKSRFTSLVRSQLATALDGGDVTGTNDSE